MTAAPNIRIAADITGHCCHNYLKQLIRKHEKSQQLSDQPRDRRESASLSLSLSLACPLFDAHKAVVYKTYNSV